MTSKALGSVLPEHKKLPANLASSLEQDDFLNEQNTGAKRAFELQEIVVSNGVIGGNVSSAVSAAGIGLGSPPPFDEEDAMLAKRRGWGTPPPFDEEDEMLANRRGWGSPPPFDKEDAKLARRLEAKAAARAALKQRVPGATASASLAHVDAQNASSAAWAAGDGWGSPPPFDDEDAKLAQRREEKAAVRAALKQSLSGAKDASGLQSSEVRLHRKSSAAVEAVGSPPQSDADAVKEAQRREEKAAARAAQNAKQIAAVEAFGSPPPFDDEDAKLAQRREEKAAARAAQKQSLSGAKDASGLQSSEARLQHHSIMLVESWLQDVQRSNA